MQHAYGKALESGLFSRFEVCSSINVEGDEVVAITHYLFGVQDFTSLVACLFFFVNLGDVETSRIASGPHGRGSTSRRAIRRRSQMRGARA